MRLEVSGVTTISLAAFSKDADPDAIATFLLKINPFQGLSRPRDEHEQMNFKNEEYKKATDATSFRRLDWCDSTTAVGPE